jgi:hypothetical protein
MPCAANDGGEWLRYTLDFGLNVGRRDSSPTYFVLDVSMNGFGGNDFCMKEIILVCGGGISCDTAV